jgi:arylsulfatase A-like enzyme
MCRLRHFALQILAAAVLSLPAFAAKPNIVFILSDDHSYPYLGCYGYSGLKTPNLDRFAAEGMKFHRAFTTSPQCVPSRASLMTGRSAVACRMTRFSSPMPRDEVTFPELLRKEAGYFVGVLGRNYHLDGSDKKDEAAARTFKENRLATFKDRFDYVDSSGSAKVLEKTREFFAQRPAEKPFFLWVNFSDPHHPWTSGKNPPAPASLKLPDSLPDLPGVRADLSRYLGEIEHMDKDFQGVLDIVKEKTGLDNTLIVFMGDNGMALPGGKGSLHDPGINVPLLARWPGVLKPGSESKALISGEDLAPTCLQAAGIKVPERMSGISFLPLLKGDAFTPRKHVFAERGPHGGLPYSAKITSGALDYSRAVRSDCYKLIYNVTPTIAYAPVDCTGQPVWHEMVAANKDGKLPPAIVARYFTNPRPVYELYDVENDPFELNNLTDKPQTAEIGQKLKAALVEKMILDFDYLPLPDSGGSAKKKGKGKSE